MAAIQNDGNVMAFSATNFSEDSGELSVTDVRDLFMDVGCEGVTVHRTQGFNVSRTLYPRRGEGRIDIARITRAMSREVNNDIVTMLYLGSCRETKKCIDDVGAGGGLTNYVGR